MACAELLQTQAFIDGELSGPDAEAAERHVENCAHCQAFCEESAALSDRIRSYAPRYAAPNHLKLRVREAIAEASVEAPAPRHPWAWLGRLRRAMRDARSRVFLGGFMGGVGVTGFAAAL